MQGKMKEMFNGKKQPNSFFVIKLERTYESRHCDLLSHHEQNTAATEKATENKYAR